jgi:uncharacterized delta-60 repeat protein
MAYLFPMKKVVLFLLLVCWLLSGYGRWVTAQVIDPTLQISNLHRAVGAVAAIQQTDGKHVVIGPFTIVEGNRSSEIARYNADHTPDVAFNTNVAGLTGQIKNVRQLPSGKLLLLGSDTLRLGAVKRVRLLRLNADGTPDASFDAGSVLPRFTSILLATAVQPDGKILLGGDFLTFSGVPATRLLRLLPDGARDTGFTPGVAFNAEVQKIFLQPDGKLLVGGRFTNPNKMVRLLPDGSVDNTFSSPHNNNAASNIGVIGLQPDGKIIVAGRTTLASTSINVARLLPNGSLDTSFQPLPTSSSLSVVQPLQQEASDVVVLPDGRIVIGGIQRMGVQGGVIPSTAALVCFNGNGTLNSTFYNLFRERPNTQINSLVRQTNGQLLVTATEKLFADQRSGISLLNTDGTYEQTFSPNLLTLGYINSVAQQADGRLVVGGGFDEIHGVRAENLARLNTNGTVDVSFTSASKVAYNVSRVAVTSAGQVLAASSNEPGLQRFLSTGAPDPSFQPNLDPAELNINRMVVQPDGRIIIAAFAGPIRRLLANGQPDPGFAPFVGGGVNNVTTLTLQPDGKLLVGGDLNDNPTSPFYNLALIRLTATGQRDASFTEMPWVNSFRVGSVELQSTGNIVVGADYTATGQTKIVRLLPNGQSDPTFGVLTSARTGDGVRRLIVLPNDQVMVAEYISSLFPTGNTLNRLLANGQPDPTFYAVEVVGDVIDLRLQQDGKLVVAGSYVGVGSFQSAGLTRLDIGNVLSTAQRRTEHPLMIWPVPAHDQLHLRLSKATLPLQLQLLDAVGRSVRCFSPAVSSGEQVLSLHGMPAGVYLLRVDYAEGPVTRRVVVQ